MNKIQKKVGLTNIRFHIEFCFTDALHDIFLANLFLVFLYVMSLERNSYAKRV